MSQNYLGQDPDYYQPQKAVDLLELFSNEQVLREVYLSLAGLQETEIGTLKQYRVPLFDLEGIEHLLSVIRPYFSHITGFSNLLDDEIREKIISLARNVSTFLVTHKKTYHIKPEVRDEIHDLIVDLAHVQMKRSQSGWAGEMAGKSHTVHVNRNESRTNKDDEGEPERSPSVYDIFRRSR